MTHSTPERLTFLFYAFQLLLCSFSLYSMWKCHVCLNLVFQIKTEFKNKKKRDISRGRRRNAWGLFCVDTVVVFPLRSLWRRMSFSSSSEGQIGWGKDQISRWRGWVGTVGWRGGLARAGCRCQPFASCPHVWQADLLLALRAGFATLPNLNAAPKPPELAYFWKLNK